MKAASDAESEARAAIAARASSHVLSDMQVRSGKAGAPVPDTEMMLMLKRIMELEKQVQRLTADNAAKSDEMQMLRRALSAAKDATTAAASDATHTHVTDDVATLQKENAKLRRRIDEMNEFLRDYGLYWVGSPGTQESAPVTSQAAQPQTVTAPPAADAEPIDFPVLLLRLRQLNDLVGAGRARVVKKDGAARLEVPTGTPLVLYSNGFVLGGGRLREYEEPSAKSFIQDILDGYFPSELKHDHPSGLVLEVIDRTDRAFPVAQVARRAVSGDARAVGAIHGLASMGEGALNLDTSRILAALPETVIIRGEVVPVRRAIASELSVGGGAAPAAVTSIDTTVDRLPSPTPAGTAATKAQLLLKLVDLGREICMVMYAADTVADLIGILRSRLVTDTGLEMTLRAGYPVRELSDDSATLQAAGLCPRATVYVSTPKRRE